MFNIYMPFYPIPRAPFSAIIGIHLQISIDPKSSCVSSHSPACHPPTAHSLPTCSKVFSIFSWMDPRWRKLAPQQTYKGWSFYVGWVRGMLVYGDSQSSILPYLKRISPTSVGLLFSGGTPDSWPSKAQLVIQHPAWQFFVSQIMNVVH